MVVEAKADRWCILRTAGPRTLPLARSLVDAGFDAWTPVVSVKRRMPRKQEKVETRAPLTPTFVFVREDALEAIQRLSRSPSNPHPAFSVFQFNGKAPRVADREIERLRVAERQAVPRRKRRTLSAGAMIRPSEGAYAGLEGVVRQSDGKYTLVAFGGWMDVQIETVQLLGDEVGTDHACMATAA